MKPQITFKFTSVTMTLILLSTISVLSQTTWQQKGNNNVTDSTDKVGSINCNKVELIADSITAITLEPDCNGSVNVIFNAKEVNYTGVGNIDFMGSTGIRTDTSATSGTKCVAQVTGPVVAFAWEGICTPQAGYGTGLYGEGGKTGVSGKANGGAANKLIYGFYGTALGSNTLAKKYGGYGNASGSGNNFGLYGIASGNALNFGVYGNMSGTISGSCAGYFNGNLQYTGQLIGPSDLRLKENVMPFEHALIQLKKLSAKTYEFKNEFSFMNLPKGKQIGLISQEVEKVFPELVVNSVHPASYDDETGEQLTEEVSYKGINYLGLIPVLVEAVNEQQQIIESVEKENSDLKQQLALLINRLDKIEAKQNESCYQNNSIQKSQTSSPSSHVPRPPSLYQNNPNPFSENTIINYFIPENSGNAVINIFTSENKLVKSFSIAQKGEGQILIEGGSFASGTYIYELVIDGKVAASNKMIKTAR